MWQELAVLLRIPSFLLPTPLEIAGAYAGNINWYANTMVTLDEAIVGFIAGTAAGLALAVVITESKLLNRILMPYIVTAQVLPKVALAPILYILFGFTYFSRILLVSILGFFPVLINVATGLTDVDPNLIYLLKTLGAGELKILYKVRFPNALPALFDGLKIGISGALIGAVVAEFVSSSAGLGFLIIVSQSSFNTVLAFASLAILTLLGLGLYGIVIVAARLAMPWFRRH